MSRIKQVTSGGFRHFNSLNRTIDSTAISNTPQTSYTSQRFAPPPEDAEDANDDVVETFNNVSPPSCTRPQRPKLMSQKRTSPGHVSGADRQDERPTKYRRRNSSIEISSDSEIPKVADSVVKQDKLVRTAPEKTPAKTQQSGEAQESQLPSRSLRPGRSTKKRPALDSSDDELVESTPSKAAKQTGASSASYRNGQISRPTKRTEPKSAIRKTTFNKPHDKLSLPISCAVSSKWLVMASESDHSSQLHLESVNPNLLRPVTAGVPMPEHPWLEVKFNTCKSVKHSSSGGRVVLIKRSYGDNVPAELALEFKTSKDHDEFLSWINERSGAGNSPKLVEEDASWMEKAFRRKLAEQKSTAVNQVDRPQADDIRYLEHQERLMLARDAHKEQSASQWELDEEKPAAQTSLRGAMKVDAPPPSSRTRASTLSPSGAIPGRPLEPPRTRRALLNPRPIIPSLPERWVDKHPDWVDIWDKQPLIYPAQGRNPAQIAKDDMLRLEEGELLNDNIIVFYLRYLQIQLEKENKALADRIYFMNPWFYEKLTHGRGRSINYDAVKSWTARVDLLSHDYVVVPINEHMHWYLAIICHPSKLIPSEKAEETPTSDTVQEDAKRPAEGDPMELDDSVPRREPQATGEDDVQVVSGLGSGSKSDSARMTSSKIQPGRKAKGTRQVDPTEPRVITLDSLGGPHSRTCINLRDYLVQEIKHRRNIDIDPPSPFGMTAKGIPEQDDFSSCGVYLLAYMERFLKNPDQVVRDITAKVHLGWNINTSKLRGEIRELIIELRLEQNARVKAEKKAKRQAKKKQSASSQKTTLADMPTTDQEISGTSDPSPGTKGGKASPSDCQSSGSPRGSRSPARVPTPEGQAGGTRPSTTTEAVEPVRSSPGQTKHSPRHSTERVFLLPMRDSSEERQDKELTSSANAADETKGSPRRQSSIIIDGSGPTQEVTGGEAHHRLTPPRRQPEGLVGEEGVQSTSRTSTPPRKAVSTADAIAIDDSPESVTVKFNRDPIIRSPYFPFAPSAANASSPRRAPKRDEERPKDDDQPTVESGRDATVNSHEYGGTGNRPAGARIEPIVVED